MDGVECAHTVSSYKSITGTTDTLIINRTRITAPVYLVDDNWWWLLLQPSVGINIINGWLRLERGKLRSKLLLFHIGKLVNTQGISGSLSIEWMYFVEVLIEDEFPVWFLIGVEVSTAFIKHIESFKSFNFFILSFLSVIWCICSLQLVILSLLLVTLNYFFVTLGN